MTTTPTSSQTDLGWIHHLERGTSGRTLLLLHGTGGNEHDLLPLGRQLDPQANLLSVRGRSLEEGAPRFFRRITPTRYDQPHLISEADALAEFVREAAELYDLDAAQVYAVGYSNGANIALATLLRQPDALAGAVLLRPVLALEEPPAPDLSGKRVLLLGGERDPFAPYGVGIAPLLQKLGAIVQETRLPVGHELTQEDVKTAQNWLSEM
ncbi:phospholipase/Carboxylesterase (plasmid) [Deinococcus proteolyticus MRP]|uniref:Phospholipase/Carboxylesterase n=1 Tax=Deinococcus proteolyticus (strain ATCC 35074 / DSM 20540 / JCM 6276 / NBRC 101906 / NCIMB 13154 / VKM Ac-1939 / CCM 2703 / MRP) TaxID=693977 RepID=F0RQT9_DEIPM|nr:MULTISPECIES: alpha/beta hydrolase [Deinococcus]ADY27648.1 phospholipase/Carboxylesterase [Deinococcus proteolyticus MRP]MCY1703525.1 alpha/beta hydrolase [Deinococcus sp. SL84]